MNPSDDYVYFDQCEDMLASLELLDSIAPELTKRPSYWKWMIVGAENALQGAMACALDTDALTKDSKDNVLKRLGKFKGNTPKHAREICTSPLSNTRELNSGIIFRI
jgi:hypothetical protein